MRPAWIEVDLDAYRHNIRALAEYAGVPVLAVVKANGYGHGLVPMSRAAVDAGCPGVGVALPEEGAELREAGQPGRILVMGLSLEEQADLLVRYDLDAVVTRQEMLRAVSEAAGRLGRTASVHVKVDTGMSRVGVPHDQAVALCGEALSTAGMRLAGVMTHFASAEAPDGEQNAEQWARFEPLVREFSMWLPRPALHAANSAAALWFPLARLDWVRAGLLTYGVSPGGDRPLPVPVRPVASIRAKITQVREVPAGSRVSYGGTWTAERTTRLALAPLGYADGIPWALGNRGAALIHGRRAPIRGRVCMDQIILDVTNLPPVRVGDVATFLGGDGAERITAEEIASLAGTIPYEVLTGMATRLPRVHNRS
jgi:alanine racemase